MWKNLRVLTTVLAVVCANKLAFAHSPMENKQAHDLARLVDQSNLVFTGQARKIVYRNARGESGEGVIPYTIVTYGIAEVLRGKAPGQEITMRFVGGPDGRGRFLTVSGVPTIQEGDRDLLFILNTNDASCPLVSCEYGRYRILNEQVFDTHGSPVGAIVDGIVISRGTPPKEFQTIRFAAPQFDELIKNPEVIAQLKSQNISEDEARRRYQAEAPKFVELKLEVPIEERTTDAGKGGSSAGNPSPEPPAILSPDALPLSRLIAVTRALAQQSKRKPIEQRSIDPASDIVPAKLTVARPQTISPPAPRKPATQRDVSESKAFEKNRYDPVIPK